MSKNIIIGVGNILFCDDGIGVIAAKYLEKNFEYEPELEIIDGGTLGLKLIEYFVEYDNVFIIDTISTDGEAGDIYKIPSQELLGGASYKKTAHEVEVVQMLETCELYDIEAHVTIFGIVPEDINKVQIGISETLKSKFGMLIETIISSVEELGIKVTKKADSSLENIIKELTC